MSNVFLITRPNYDQGTNYLFLWTKSILGFSKKRGWVVLNLSDKKANRKSFLSYIKKQNPKFIFFNGHGSATTINGHNGEMLVETGKDKIILKGKIIYARCCEAAKVFGRQCIKEGVLAFIGYKEKYLLGYSKRKVLKPLNDEVAKLFMEPSNLIALSILKGNSVEHAFIKSQKQMSKNLSFMMSTKATYEQRNAVQYLHSNKMNQVLLGDFTSKAS